MSFCLLLFLQAPSCSQVADGGAGGLGGGDGGGSGALPGWLSGGWWCSSSLRARKIPSNILNCECWKCFMAFQLDLFPFCMFYLFIFGFASRSTKCASHPSPLDPRTLRVSFPPSKYIYIYIYFWVRFRFQMRHIYVHTFVYIFFVIVGAEKW